MNIARTQTGWLRFSFLDEPRTILKTTQPIDEEIFATIKYYSEIKNVGVDFMKKLGHSKPKENWLLFQSFIRQAETFHQSANLLNYRAAALMHYYSFLNLAKGFICLSDPDYVTQAVGHGLRHKFHKGSFSSQHIIAENKGVFPKLYETIIGTKIPQNTKLNIIQLLGYCTDISHEYKMSGFGKSRTHPAIVRLLGNSSRKESWPLLSILNNSDLVFPKDVAKKFDLYIKEVSFPLEQSREVFNIYAEGYRAYRFFETHKTYQWIDNQIPLGDIRRDFNLVMRGIYEIEPYDNEYSIMLFGAIQDGKQKVQFNQTLAIYAIMFYLGSLVRYRPDYLEHLLNSKEAWIIERVTKSACNTFLRSFVNYVLGKEYIFSNR